MLKKLTYYLSSRLAQHIGAFSREFGTKYRDLTIVIIIDYINLSTQVLLKIKSASVRDDNFVVLQKPL